MPCQTVLPAEPSGPMAPSGRRAIWRAIFLGATAVWVAAMLASLHWRFLDRFVVATRNGRIGWDFFQTPRGFRNLLAGNSIFLTEISDYGPYATAYFNHPFVAVAVGPWTAPLAVLGWPLPCSQAFR